MVGEAIGVQTGSVLSGLTMMVGVGWSEVDVLVGVIVSVGVAVGVGAGPG